MFCLAAVLFNIAFPTVFQSWLDVLSVLSMDLYTFVGECYKCQFLIFNMGIELGLLEYSLEYSEIFP